MSGEYTTTVRRPDPRKPTSWCGEGVSHDHQACGLGPMWDSSDPRDVEEAVRWADAQRAALWRFDVPIVPASVTAMEVEGVPIVRVAETPSVPGGWWARFYPSGNLGDARPLTSWLVYAPLVECEDPRKTEGEDRG